MYRQSSPLCHLHLLICIAATGSSIIILVAAQNNGTQTQQSNVPFVVGTEAAATQSPRKIFVTKGLRSQTKAPEPDEISSRKFQSDCSDPHNKYISCSVHIVSCDEELFDLVEVGQEPPEAHDVRVNSYAKAVVRPKGQHTLHVDVSWQMPPGDASTRIKAFKMKIEPTDEEDANTTASCFAFNVTNFNKTDDDSSPRFHFSTESLFSFSAKYRVSLLSLPASLNKQPKVVKDATMPENPEGDDQLYDPQNVTEYCRTHTHPAASKWTAGFRKIFLMSVARTIQIEFVGAPPQYCFEQYEVRLLDGSGIEMLYHETIDAKDLKWEMYEGKLMAFGEYNFTGLELDTEYIPSVIPVETSSDNRCLCPTESHACSCIAADWKKVKLDSLKPSNLRPYTVPPPAIVETSDNWLLFSLLLLFCMVVALIALVSVIIMFYRKYRRRGKAVRIRFISDSSNAGVSSEPKTPLIYNSSTSVLILYSHDCLQHEATVIAFAELLRDSFGLDVHMDTWDSDEIESNLAEYVNASIVKADKIVIINSLGAYHRVRARHLKQDLISRVDGGIYDTIFLNQIDLALQHARVVSVRFSYTPSSNILFALSPLLQYSVPENLGLLVSSLVDCPLKNDSRLAGYNPGLVRLNTAISKMATYIQNEPRWFELTHHRIMNSKSTITVPCTTDATDSSLDSGIVELHTHPLNTEGEEKQLQHEYDQQENELQTEGLASGLPRAITDSGILSDECANGSNGIAEAMRRSIEENEPLLEPTDDTAGINTNEIVNEEEDMQTREKGELSNRPQDDSAYYSQSINTEADPISEVLDKPRLTLSQYTEKCSKKAENTTNGSLLSELEKGIINAAN